MSQDTVTHIIVGACVGIAVVFGYFYFRPPQGDRIPVSKETLDHMERRDGRQGDYDDRP